MQIDGETVKTKTDFIFGAPKSLQMVTVAIKIKRHLLLGRKSMTNLDSILKSRDPGIEPRSPALQAESSPSEPPGKAVHLSNNAIK